MEKPQLFLIHFAGGSRYSFQFMSSYLSNFRTTALELPGRGRRVGEQLLTTTSSAVEDLKKQILLQLSGNKFVIYGHSLGALLALHITASLEAENIQPLGIVVSGNAGPGMHEKNFFSSERNAFKKELRELGGVPEDFLNNDELFDFYEPIFRADFEIVQHEEQYPLIPIKAPIYAVMGSEELFTNRIDNWHQYTLSSFDKKILKGGHFFIYENAEEIAKIFDKLVVV